MKKGLALATAFLLGLTAVACNNGTSGGTSQNSSEPGQSQSEGQTENGSQSEAPSGEETTIKWALWDYEQTAYYDAIIEGYKKVNPNVTIETVDLGSSDYSNMLQTQMAGGSDFDVVTIKDTPGYTNLVVQDLLEPLDDFIAQEGIDLSLYGGTTEQVTIDDKLYQLPFRSDFWIVYYNKAIFDEMNVPYPTNDMTLEDYDALARKLVHGEGNDKIYGAHYHTWRSAVQLFSILDGKHTVYDYPYDWMKDTYELILKEQEDGVVMDYPTAVSTSAHYRDLFYNGRMAMMNMGSWQIGSHIMAVKDGETDVKDWGIVKYPHPAGVEAGTTLGTITGLSVNKKAPHKEAALDFVKWVTGEDGAKEIAKTGTIPAIHTPEVMEEIANMEGFPQDQNSKDALNTTQIYLEMPVNTKAGEVEVILNEEHTEIMSGTKTVEQGLADMSSRVEQVLKD
jgi:multiple sugar transport system substrate-binding protein